MSAYVVESDHSFNSNVIEDMTFATANDAWREIAFDIMRDDDNALPYAETFAKRGDAGNGVAEILGSTVTFSVVEI